MENRTKELLYSEVGNYFFKTEKLHDVHFLVGDNKERIGAVRLLLINQSAVWWSMLSEDSSLVEKNDISLPDIEPEVFILLLKHSYGGLDDLSSLSPETVVKLCVIADMYFMKSLLKKISSRLQPETVDVLFPALHCMVNYNLQEVEKSVNEMIQKETAKIFCHPDFLECDVESVTYITNQEPLDCHEIELWRAVVTWAKHKAQSDEGSKLREWMAQPLQNIRLLTLDMTDIHNEVFTSGILTHSEIINICKKNVSGMKSLCGTIEVRGLHLYRDVVYEVYQSKQNLDDDSVGYSTNDKSCSCILVKNRNIILQSITFKGYDDIFYSTFKSKLLFGYRFTVDITITISCITNVMTNTSNETPLVVVLKSFQYDYLSFFDIPIKALLKANSKYKITILFSHPNFICYTRLTCFHGHEFEHGTFYCSQFYRDGVGVSCCHILQFKYSASVI